MVRKTFFLPLLVGALARIVSAEASSPNNVLPGSYIVEFDDSQDMSLFHTHAASMDAEIVNRFDYTLFKGATVQFKNLEAASQLAAEMLAMPMVKQMWPNRQMKSPSDKVVWASHLSNQTQIDKRQDTNDTFSPHVMTQVDKLRAKGITGKGVKIAIVDSGIDYTHDALGGCFGPGCLVAGGYDFVDNDDDPLDTCNGYGTHVAGIIAAQENPLGFTGAAPVSSLLHLRPQFDGFLTYTHRASKSWLIEYSAAAVNPRKTQSCGGFMRAHEDGADIISASLGDEAFWDESPGAMGVTVTRIVAAGIPCIAAAGNSGNMGLFFVSQPASEDTVVSVASFDNTVTTVLKLWADYSVDRGEPREFSFTTTTLGQWSEAPAQLPVFASLLDIDSAANGCNPFPADTPDLSGSVVLTRQGTCSASKMAARAAAFGAKYVMFWGAEPGTPMTDSLTDGIIASGMVSKETAEELTRLLKAGSNITLTLPDPEKLVSILREEPNKSTGGYASTYTSWGPSFEGATKPQFAAPGGNILSTYPGKLARKGQFPGYAVLVGTSMSAPLVAAAFALVHEVRGKLRPAEFENLLSATSNPQFLNDGRKTFDMLAPVAQQGAGMIQVYDAAYATTLLDRSSLAFGDADHHADVLSFAMSNTGREEVTYELGAVGAATAYTFSNGTYPDPFPGMEFDDVYATINLSESKITLAPGARKFISVRATPPAVNATRLPVYSGYVTINGTNGESLSLPYQGVAGSLHNTRVIGFSDFVVATGRKDKPWVYPPAIDTLTFNFTKGGSDKKGLSQSQPGALTRLAFGTSLVHIEAVKVDSGNVTLSNSTTNLGNILGSPLLWLNRHLSLAPWHGQLADGSYAPKGRYCFAVRALHVFGDQKNETDYDVAFTGDFNIQYYL
ncbi:uncharacterized protein PG986_008549 [Apiospora aurea]|uniref:Subtilisin-like protease n=1 Tax=Apiospora aurea TaxID=335848 RepID=A0ABR1QFR7_9PEZI